MSQSKTQATLGIPRRQFLQAGAVFAGALASSQTMLRRALAAPSEKVRVAAIGVGTRATLLLEQLPEGAEIVALSDCNLPRAEAFKAKHKTNCDVYQDYRKVLDRKDVDAVIVATQEWQRVIPCIHACQAGKDVYAEKPLTLYIHEGRALVNAVRNHKRVLQVGSQQRSMEMNRIACKYIRDGGLGKITEVRAVNYTGPGALLPSPLPEQPLPPNFDWNIWLNQVSERNYNPGYGGQLDMVGGEMTNWGAHGIDQVQWALDMDGTGPVEIWPISSGLNGQVGMRYANGVELNFVLDKGPHGGAIFVGEKGKLEINRNKFTSNPGSIAEALLKDVNVAEEERKWSDSLALWQARWHLQNWLDCIRSREKPVADVEIGHRSISVCHLANIARYEGRKLQWDPKAERFVNDDAANKWVVRERRKGWELPEVL